MKYLFFLLIFSSNTFARECHRSAELHEEWNSKYSSLIKIEVSHESDEAYNVLVKLPDIINNEKLTSVKLNLVRDKKHLLLSTELVIFQLDGGSTAYYEIGKGLESQNYIVVQYGEYFCGIVVSKELKLYDKT